MKILIIDDDIVILEAVAFTLKNDGYDVVTAEDGYTALEIIDNEDINLIICDVMMPELSGLSLLSLLKQFHYSRTPVILMSSLDKANVISSALGLGASDFITKPINFEELSLRVKKVISSE